MQIEKIQEIIGSPSNCFLGILRAKRTSVLPARVFDIAAGIGARSWGPIVCVFLGLRGDPLLPMSAVFPVVSRTRGGLLTF